MVGIYGNHPEDRARELELNQYLDGQSDDRAERVAGRAAELYNEALNDEAAFNTLNDDYEVLDAYKPQIMRVLRNMDKAILCDEISMVALYTALSIIQANLKNVCEEVADGEIK